MQIRSSFILVADSLDGDCIEEVEVDRSDKKVFRSFRYFSISELETRLSPVLFLSSLLSESGGMLPWMEMY